MSAAAAAEQVTEQPQTEEQQTETVEEDASEIAAAFGIAVDEPESEETEESEESSAQAKPPGSKPAKADPELEKTDPLDLVKNDELFSEKALSNQPGIGKARHALLAARKAVRDAAQNNHRTHLELSDREARIREGGADLKKRTQAFEAHEKRFLADIDIAMNGKPGEVLEALGRIARRSGSEVYEGMTAALLEAKKNAPKIDPETAKKLSKIDELEAKLAKYEEKEGQRSGAENAAAARKAWVDAVVTTFQANAEDYTNLSHFVEAGHGAEVLADVEAVNQELWEAAGRPSKGIPLAVLLGEVDRRYAKLERTEPEKPAPKKTGRLPGNAPSPARAATNGHQRELTEEERVADLAADKEALRAFGFSV